MRQTAKFIIILFFLPFYLFAYDLPDISKDEIATLLVSEIQLKTLLTRVNYASETSPRGVCYGIDRINYTLLTLISFEPGKRDPHTVIEEKLLMAQQQKIPQTIRGFSDLKEFLETMEPAWNKFYNPLKEAVEKTQFHQNPYLNVYKMFKRAKRLMYHGKEAVYAESNALMHHLTNKTPVSIGVYHWGAGHALTVIGYSQKLNVKKRRPFIDTFYVLDSNLPWKVQKLILKIENEGTAQETAYWYYPTWEHNEALSPYVYLIFNFPTKEDQTLAQIKFDFHFHVHPIDPRMLTFRGF